MKLVAKLTSRKFLALLTALVVTILVAFNVDNTVTERIVGIIGAFTSVCAYIFGEAYVDGNNKTTPLVGTAISFDEIKPPREEEK